MKTPFVPQKERRRNATRRELVRGGIRLRSEIFAALQALWQHQRQFDPELTWADFVSELLEVQAAEHFPARFGVSIAEFVSFCKQHRFRPVSQFLRSRQHGVSA